MPLWVVPTHALQIQDGGRPPSWKNRKIVTSQPRFERFWRNLAWWRISTLLSVPTVKNLKFQKSKMAAAAILKNGKTPYLSRSSTDFDEIWHADAVRPSWLFRLLKFWSFQNPRWRRPPSWKIENWHISSAVWAISTKFGTVTQFVLLDCLDR